MGSAPRWRHQDQKTRRPHHHHRRRPPRVVSGGANARQLVYGAPFGGGNRTSKITRKTRRGRATYSARTTRQFARHAQETIFPAIRREGGWVLDQFAEIVAKVLTAGVTHE